MVEALQQGDELTCYPATLLPQVMLDVVEALQQGDELLERAWGDDDSDYASDHGGDYVSGHALRPAL